MAFCTGQKNRRGRISASSRVFIMAVFASFGFLIVTFEAADAGKRTLARLRGITDRLAAPMDLGRIFER